MSFDKKINSKKHIWRRFLIFMLCFCILLTVYPAFVFAQEGNTDISTSAEQENQVEAVWNDAEGNLYGSSFLDAVKYVKVGGTIALLSDISLEEPITVSKPMMITSYYSNAPCTIKNTTNDTDDGNEIGRIFTVTGGCQLALQNIILDGGKSEGVTAYHPLICINGAYLFMFDGTVLQNAENKASTFCGGGVNIRNGGLRMQSGSMITDCNARHGGGVQVNSRNGSPNDTMLIMDSGSVIKNCTADSGGGVYVNIGQFQLLGGEITDNIAACREDSSGGGGIFVAASGNSTAAVRIVDGKIAGNTSALHGGGIFVNGGHALLQIEGGTIEKNNARFGGGICVFWGSMNLYGGTVTGNIAESYGGGVLGMPESFIVLQGNPKVFENIAKDKEDRFDNLYLDGNTGDNPTSPIKLIGPLTDGVKIGMTLWVRPDDNEHPYWPMIMPYGGYKITQEDFDRLCYDRSAENKELYADNIEKFAYIPYNGEIVMVLAVDVELDKENLHFEGSSDLPISLTATVTPDNAPEKGVTWSSSDENVATVDENGVVTPISEGRAVITATTKSPYHATASCNVTVGYYRLATKSEHGTITYTPVEPDDYFPGGERVKLSVYADKEYRLNSLKAYHTGDETAEVAINDNTLIMPDCDVTVEAVFKPISYKISYDLAEGALNQNETNPDSYTIEDGEITLNNPVRSGYTFVGWTGTELSSPTLVVKIPIGSTGDREYTAVWEKEDSDESTDSEDTNQESSETSDNGSVPSDNNSEPSDNGSETSDNGSKPSDSDSESSYDNSEPSDNGSEPSDNNSEPTDSDAPLTINENEQIPSESKPTFNDYNPPTGVALSFASLMAITVTAAFMRKRK